MVCLNGLSLDRPASPAAASAAAAASPESLWKVSSLPESRVGEVPVGSAKEELSLFPQLLCGTLFLFPFFFFGGCPTKSGPSHK